MKILCSWISVLEYCYKWPTNPRQWPPVDLTRGHPGFKTKIEFSTVVCTCRGECVHGSLQCWDLGLLKLNCHLASAAGPRLRCFLTELKPGHLCWDSALNLWLLDHFELGFVASRKGRWKPVGSDNSLKWPQISKRRQRNNKQYTVETRYVIFIEKFSEFLPSKRDRKYSHTNWFFRRDRCCARWSLILALSVSLGRPWCFIKLFIMVYRVIFAIKSRL